MVCREDYNDRLKELGITTLEARRKRSDLIEAFKIMNGFDDVNRELLFSLAINTAHLRGHDLIFFQKSVKLNVRKNFFSQRVVNYWNKLPETAINSTSITKVKNRMDCHLMFSRGYI